MDNLQTAKAAIEAELANTRQGLVYYQARVTTLEETLAAVADAIAQNSTSSSPAKKKSELALPAAAVQGKKRGRKPGTGKKANSNGLPSTGGDYWINLVSAQPKSGPEILNSAIGSLSFAPTKEQVKKLAGRMTFALNALVKTKGIQDSGAGRERRFFK